MNTTILTIILSMFPLTNDTGGESITSVNLSKSTNYETVTLTTYAPTEGETDSTPHITASGYKIDLKNPKKHRIIAVSRDLKRKWRYGTKVRIRNAGKYNGVYTVKDVMNKRYKKRIDILIGHNDKQTTLNNVKITKIK